MAESYGVKGLAHIGVIVSDTDRSVEFYRDKLGFTLDESMTMDGGMRLTFLSAGGCVIELVERADHTTAFAPGQVDHICLDVQGIDELIDSLKAKGVTFLADKAATLTGGLTGKRNIFLLGPDGERLEFFEG